MSNNKSPILYWYHYRKDVPTFSDKCLCPLCEADHKPTKTIYITNDFIDYSNILNNKKIKLSQEQIDKIYKVIKNFSKKIKI